MKIIYKVSALTATMQYRRGLSAMGLIMTVFLFVAAHNLKAQTPTAFTCQDGVSYVTRTVGAANTNTGLYQFDMTTGEYTTIAQPLVVPASSNLVDAIGYNPVDNFIWGSATGTNYVVKVGSNGAAESYPVAGLPGGNYIAGDVDGNGFLYLYAASASSLYKINLNSSPSPTLETTFSVSTAFTLRDFSVNASGTQIYGIAEVPGTLVTISLSGTSASTATTPTGSIPASANWNTFLDDQNNLYLQRYNGTVYRITPAYSNANVSQVIFDGPSVNNSDGARCSSARIQANPVPDPFVCADGVSYVSKTSGTTNINTGLYTFNQQTGIYTTVAEPILFGSSVNAIGYNEVDHFVWGAISGTNSLIKIGSNGGTETFTVAGLPTGTYEAGDVDASGNFYLYSGNGGSIYKIDLTTTPSPTLITTYSYAAGSTITDFKVSDDGSLLRGIVQGNGNLATITLSGTTAIQTTSSLPLGTGIQWNVFGDSEDNLFVQNRSNGNTFLVAAPHYNHAQQILTSSGNVFNSDGAYCGSSSLLKTLIPFTCTTYQYQVTANSTGGNSTLWQYNPILGTRTSLGGLPGYINAIGYNPIDNFIWGATAGNTISKLDAEANWVQYRIPNLPSPSNHYYVGDISQDGYFFLYESGGSRYYVIDLNPARSTYLELVDPTIDFVLDDTAPFGADMSPARTLSDWAFNPVDNQLYAVLDPVAASPYRLMKMDPLTGISTISATAVSGGGFQQSTDAYGAVFFDGNGNFYVVSNGTGYFYRVDLTTYAATRVSTAGVSINFNDGAGCATAPPILTDLGDAPDSYGTLFNSNGPAHIISPNLKIGIHVDGELDAQPTSDANGDDLAGTPNDEDGVAIIPDLTTESTTYSLTVKVTNTTGSGATLAGWVDFNGDGIFQDTERTEVSVPDGATSVVLTWNGLSGIVAGNNYIRLRLASDVDEILLPTGAASNGEVEDYRVGVTPLPVKLTEFTVRAEAQTTLLSWSTVEEINSDRFEIQRSGDAKNWVRIGERDAMKESKVLTSYHFTDAAPLAGINYYRLRMIDLDQTFAYSPIRSIRSGATTGINVYPNPSAGLFKFGNVDVTSIKRIEIRNLLGQIIYQAGKVSPDGIQINGLPTGIYILKMIHSDNAVFTQKLMIQQ